MQKKLHQREDQSDEQCCRVDVAVAQNNKELHQAMFIAVAPMLSQQTLANENPEAEDNV